MAGLKTFKVTCTLANTAYNVVSGTTAAASTPWSVANKGISMVFQMQTSGATGTVAGSDVITNAGVKFIGPDGAYSPDNTRGSSSFHAEEWWVASDTAGAVVVVQLLKHV